MYKEKCALMKKEEILMRWPERSSVEKTDNGVKMHRISGKEKAPGATVSKKGLSDHFSDTKKEPLLLISLEKMPMQILLFIAYS